MKDDVTAPPAFTPLWGSRTQHALDHFNIGNGSERMPAELIHAFGIQKKAAALVNVEFELLSPEIGNAISAAADEVVSGELDDHFTLSIWQSGAGAETNMNLNEVIANRVVTTLGDSESPAGLIELVNLNQTTFDSFPTAMHIALGIQLTETLLPALQETQTVLAGKAEAFKGIKKTARTYLQDSIDITLGDEFSAYAHQLAENVERTIKAVNQIWELPQGGGTVGEGRDVPEGFAEAFSKQVSSLTGHPFRSCSNKFYAMAAHDSLINLSGKLNTNSVTIMKIANDIRLMRSGPFAELTTSASEGDLRQADAVTQVAAQVMGNHVAVTVGGASGQLQLNAYKPLMAVTSLRSIKLLADSYRNFTRICLTNLEPASK